MYCKGVIIPEGARHAFGVNMSMFDRMLAASVFSLYCYQSF